MSNDEARQQKALALLQFDEATEEHCEIVEELSKLARRIDIVKSFVVNLTLGHDYSDKQADGLREQVYSMALADLVPSAIVLDQRLVGAKKRLQEAVAVKKTFGLK